MRMLLKVTINRWFWAFILLSTGLSYQIPIVAAPTGNLCQMPDIQASGISGTPGFQSISLTWVNGNGSGRIVVINTINSFTAPVDGVSPVASSVYSCANEQVVYNGSGNTVNVTGLQPCQDYWFRIYESNCSGTAIAYNTLISSANPALASTGSSMSGAQILINEDFESTPVWPYTVASVNVGSGGVVGNNVTEVRTLFGYNDSKGLVKSYSVSNGSGQTGSEATIEFNQYTLPAGSTNVRLLIRVASLNELGTIAPSLIPPAPGPYGRGNDMGENFTLRISRNGGPYQTTFTQPGYSNKLFDYTPQHSATLAWDAFHAYANTGMENNFTITFPAGTTQVQIKIVTTNNRIEEAWCVDDIQLIADVPPVSTIPQVFAITGGGDFCAGGTGVEIGLADSQTGMSYQLYLNGSPQGIPIPGTGNAITFGYQTTAGTYSVTATNITYTNCQSQMTNQVTVSINTPPVASAI